MRSVNSPRQRPQILLAADAAGPADRGASLEHLSFFSYTTGAPQTFSDSSKRRFHLSAAEGFAPLAAPTNPRAPLPLRRTLRSQSGAAGSCPVPVGSAGLQRPLAVSSGTAGAGGSAGTRRAARSRRGSRVPSSAYPNSFQVTKCCCLRKACFTS